jgi:hypothetical protein
MANRERIESALAVIEKLSKKSKAIQAIESALR